MKKLKKIVLFLLIILFPVFAIAALDNYFSDRTTVYINNKVQTTASNIITAVVKKNVINSIDMDELLIFKYDNSNQIESVIVNTAVTNEILGAVGEQITLYLADGEMKKTFSDISIPLGFLISKTLFATRGPIIKIPIIPIGTYSADIITTTSIYGINNSLLEVYLLLKMDIQAFLPLQPQKIQCSTKIVLVSELIQGEVPRYYYASDGYVPYIPENIIE